jgi:hypothetical protein
MMKKLNERWLVKMVKQGREFYTTGIDYARTVRSDYYAMELRVLARFGIVPKSPPPIPPRPGS